MLFNTSPTKSRSFATRTIFAASVMSRRGMSVTRPVGSGLVRSRSLEALGLVLGCGLVLVGAASFAGDPAAASGRYTMSPSGDGFVRLDTETGEMSFCRKQDDAWACDAMSDASAGLRAEIAKLKAENERLRDEIVDMGNQGAGAAVPPKPSIPGLNLPSEQEVDQALGYFSRLLKKFKNSMEELREGAEPPATEPPASVTPQNGEGGKAL